MMWQWSDGGMWGWGGWAVMGGRMLLLTLAAVGLVVWAVVWATRSSTAHRSYETAGAVLDRRLAAGEISGDDYAEARRLIEDRPAAPTG